MPLHGARAEKQPRADVRVREPVAGHSRDLPLLRGQIVPRLDRSLADLLARRLKLVLRALGERFHPDREEQLVGRAQLLARVDTATLAAQPLAVEQMRTSELGTQPAAAQPLDRLLIQALGGLARAYQGTGTSEDSERRVAASESRRRNDALESDARQLWVVRFWLQLRAVPSLSNAESKQLLRAVFAWVPGAATASW